MPRLLQLQQPEAELTYLEWSILLGWLQQGTWTNLWDLRGCICGLSESWLSQNPCPPLILFF